MALSSGATLGNYDIVAPIGAGGMGEVYRARDTKLQRDVAITPTSRPSTGSKNMTASRFSSWSSSKGKRSRFRLRADRSLINDAIPIFVQIAEGLEKLGVVGESFPYSQ